ncbi:BadF/BadG/BcrA/BcrD ATPase family protein [Glutamicibacter sp. PS]|uniref:N-acetylglucosamine kinase n=1 Tax=Glutamicibacter sp. PS TaxID=3075634 RepID=UPI00284B2B64|nr:BadF/BadG/BcrA/BcrD ATPase family protein [Glutamicibacter sp. PS]MDR4534365.1 hypothetical protein [Glutamicibacter sp. PS]
MTETVLAVDCGQTGIKLRLQSPGEPVRESRHPGVRTDRPLLPQLAAAVQDSGLSAPTLTFGVSGLTSAEDDAAELLAVLGDAGIERVLLTHDSVTSYLGALGDRPGAVVAAGTGVVTLAVGPHRTARVDGWGYIMGDEGSGYWIGQQALRAVMRAYDGRGPATGLSEPVRERWPRLDEAYIALQSAPDRVSRVASLAREVARWAPTDTVARDICVRAATELAHSAATALRLVTEEQPSQQSLPVAAIGGVFSNELIAEEFALVLGELQPRAEVVPADGDGLAGALRLAQLGAEHPLMHLVSEARRGEHGVGS